MLKNQIQIKNINISETLLCDFKDIYIIEKELNMVPTPYNFFENTIKRKNIKNVKISIKSDLVGYLCYQFNLKECDIISIGIKKNFQKMGLGKKLISYLELNHFNSIYAEVSSKNINGIKFYKSLGFFYVGYRRSYYKNNDNAFIMKLKIT